MEDKFIFESKKNPFEIINEITVLSQENILKAINFLKNYLQVEEVKIVNKRTYEIKMALNKIKVTSYYIEISSNNKFCNLEVSNPNDFIGARFWTKFKDRGSFWTNEQTLARLNVNPELLYNLLAHNYDWVFKKASDIYFLEKKGQFIEEDLQSLKGINNSYIEDQYGSLNSYDEEDLIFNAPITLKEDVSFKVFEKIFNR